jgi:hypothetical protein
MGQTSNAGICPDRVQLLFVARDRDNTDFPQSLLFCLIFRKASNLAYGKSGFFSHPRPLQADGR